MTYHDYIQSDLWFERKNKVMRAPYYGRPHECFVCGSKFNLVVHHLTYIRLRCELDEDLVILCDTCHHTVHFYTGKHQTKHIWMKVFELKYRPTKELEQQARIKKFGTRQKKVRKHKITFVDRRQQPIRNKEIETMGTLAYYQAQRKAIGALPPLLTASLNGFNGAHRNMGLDEFIQRFEKKKSKSKKKMNREIYSLYLQYKPTVIQYVNKLLSKP